MCGFLVELNREKALPAGVGRSLLAHRGPSSTGAGSSQHWAFVHSRLAVLDPALRSNQPFFDPSGSHALLFNGELFTYLHLRSELSSEWDFRTSGDTEVLLATLLRRGHRSLQGLSGMYAFALLDTRTGSLLLGRDPLGIKPLFIRLNGDRLTGVASTQRALTAGSGQKLDPENLRQTVLFGSSFDLSASAPQIRMLPPGGFWRVDGVGRIQEQHSLAPPSPGSHGKAFLDTFLETVERHLVADVPVGVALSGGLDSSALVAAAVELGCRPHCFTVHFPGKSASEKEVAMARLVAGHFGLPHTTIDVTPQDAIEALNRPGMWDEPFAEVATLPLNRLAAVARDRSVLVLLTGEGSDEYFGGYRRLRAYRRIVGLPRVSLGLGPLANVSRLTRLNDALRAPPSSAARYLWMSSNVGPEVAGKLLRLSEPELETSLSRWAGHDADRPFDLDAALQFERNRSLPSLYLRKLDLATMSEGVEGRVPFVDVGFIDQAPEDLGKRYLREAMQGRLPSEILTRPKQGFGAPVTTWVRGALSAKVRELLGDGSLPLWGVVDHAEARRLWAHPKGWSSGLDGLFFALYRWSGWLRRTMSDSRFHAV